MAFLDEVGLAELWSLIQAEDENLVASSVKIATGSYKGTGTSGSSNKNSLTFDFKPKVVFIVCDGGSGSSLIPVTMYVWGGTRMAVDLAASISESTVTVSGNTMSWYGGSANSQLNRSGDTFRYVAIG